MHILVWNNQCHYVSNMLFIIKSRKSTVKCSRKFERNRQWKRVNKWISHATLLRVSYGVNNLSALEYIANIRRWCLRNWMSSVPWTASIKICLLYSQKNPSLLKLIDEDELPAFTQYNASYSTEMHTSFNSWEIGYDPSSGKLVVHDISYHSMAPVYCLSK